MTLWRIRATVDDRPGFLAVLTASLALRSVNILAVQVHTTEVGAVDDFLVDAPDAMTASDLIAAVEKGRGRNAWVSPAQAQGLVDPPTQALALAGRVVRDPEALGEGLRQLLAGDDVVWRPLDDQPGTEPSGAEHAVAEEAGAEPATRPRYGFDDASMRLPDPYGGLYEVTRRAPVFTPAEYARAQALVDLAGSVVGQATARTVVLLADGNELALRLAGPEDLAAVTEMHQRCSPRTRHRRYLTGTPGPAPAQLAALLDPARSTTLVAEVLGTGETAGRIVAMATLVGEGTQAEVTLLVEDGWQGRGLGTALLRRIGTLAARLGHAALVAHTNSEDHPFLRTLRRIGRPSSIERDGVVVTVTLPLSSREVPAAVPGTEAGPGTG
jgi:GNAT superfamily N-acetyltransferase